MKRILLSVMVFAVFAAPALSWNCPSGEIRQQAPAGSPNSVVVEGITFICVPTPTPQSPTSIISNQNTNTNSNSNSNSNKNQNTNQNTNNNANTNNSLSKSVSSATGGNASAAGGSVSNSGNSSNTNTNSATGGAGGSASQGQKQTQTASASNNGNGSNNASYSNTENIAAPKIPVETAYAPSIAPTVPCFKGFGGGVQTAPVGLSFGGGRIDANCAVLEASRQAPSLIARCKVYISNKYVQKAGVTLADCMASSVTEQRVIETAPIAQTPAAPPIEVAPKSVVATLTSETPARIGNTVRVTDLGSCHLWNSKLTNVCFRLLDDAARRLEGDPGSKLILRGPVNASGAVTYLKKRIDPSRIGMPEFSDDQDNTLSIELYQESELVN